MGLWGFGVFDNDTTADFAARFDGTEPEDRLGLLESSLQEALEADEDDLEEYGAYALAAAAIVAAKLPGAAAPDSGYAPKSLAEFSLLPSPALVSLALRAFEHVVTADWEWAEMYSDAEQGAELKRLRASLAAAAG